MQKADNDKRRQDMVRRNEGRDSDDGNLLLLLCVCDVIT